MRGEGTQSQSHLAERLIPDNRAVNVCAASRSTQMVPLKKGCLRRGAVLLSDGRLAPCDPAAVIDLTPELSARRPIPQLTPGPEGAASARLVPLPSRAVLGSLTTRTAPLSRVPPGWRVSERPRLRNVRPSRCRGRGGRARLWSFLVRSGLLNRNTRIL